MVENGDGPGPYGAKGMSEGALLCVASAVAAAVRDATGVAIRDLPLSPERVWRALREADGDDADDATPSRSTPPPRHARRGEVARRRQGRQPRGDVARPRAAGAAGLHRSPPRPCRPFLAAGWPDGSMTSSGPDGRASKPPSVGGSATPSDPLLVSVRSGAPVSMPGMMDTILNLGLNEATRRARPGHRRRGLRRQLPRRFQASFRSIVGFADVPDDPWHQLRVAIEAVFRSWMSDRAGPIGEARASPTTSARRSRSRPWCSAIAAPTRRTGVLFMRNPATGSRALWRCPVRRPGRGRRRRHPCDPADRRPRRAAADGGRRGTRTSGISKRS